MNAKKRNLKKKISEVIDEELKEEKDSPPVQPATSSSTKIEKPQKELGQCITFSVQSLECALNLAFSMIMAEEGDVIFASDCRTIMHMNARINVVTSAAKDSWSMRLGYGGKEEGFTATRHRFNRKSITEVHLERDHQLIEKFDFSKCRKGTKVIFISPMIDYDDRVDECLAAGLNVVCIMADWNSRDREDDAFPERNTKIDFGPINIQRAALAFDRSMPGVLQINETHLPELDDFGYPIFNQPNKKQFSDIMTNFNDTKLPKHFRTSPYDPK